MSRRTYRTNDGKLGAISSRKLGGYIGGGREYDRLKKVAKLDEDEALKSAPWGWRR